MSQRLRQRIPGLSVITLSLLLALLARHQGRARAGEAPPEKRGAQAEEEETIPPEERPRLRALLEQGQLPVRPLTPVQVRHILGPPTAVGRELLFQRYREQWRYHQPDLRLLFDWRRGQKARLQGVQRGAAELP